MKLVELRKNINNNMSIYAKAKLIAQYNGNKYLSEVCEIFSARSERLLELVRIELVKVEIEKIEKKGKSLTIKKFIELRNKALEILKDFYTGYSMGEYKYLSIKNRNGQHLYTFNVDDTRTYSKRTMWKPKYGEFSISMTLNELETIKKIEKKWIIENKKEKKYIEEYGNKGSYSIHFRKI